MAVVRSDMVAVYVFRRLGERAAFLLLRRVEGDYLGGTWQPVYGGIRPGEKAWETALRELREETGLTPEHLYFIDTVDTFYLPSQDEVCHCIVFAAEVAPEAKIRLNDEHDAFEWLDQDVALGRYLWPGQRRAVREILAEIVVDGPARDHLRIPI